MPQSHGWPRLSWNSLVRLGRCHMNRMTKRNLFAVSRHFRLSSSGTNEWTRLCESMRRDRARFKAVRATCTNRFEIYRLAEFHFAFSFRCKKSTGRFTRDDMVPLNGNGVDCRENVNQHKIYNYLSSNPAINRRNNFTQNSIEHIDLWASLSERSFSSFCQNFRLFCGASVRAVCTLIKIKYSTVRCALTCVFNLKYNFGLPKSVSFALPRPPLFRDSFLFSECKRATEKKSKTEKKNQYERLVPSAPSFSSITISRFCGNCRRGARCERGLARNSIRIACSDLSLENKTKMQNAQ